jgi:hypothetical protein
MCGTAKNLCGTTTDGWVLIEILSFWIPFSLTQVINNEAVETRIQHRLFSFNGGDRLKFGDVVTAVASLVVIMVLLMAPLYMVLAPTLGIYLGGTVTGAVSTFLSALIVGYIFAGKILEARRETIAKITVLSAALVMVSVVSLVAALPDFGPNLKEMYQEMYPESVNWSLSEWLTAETMMIYLEMVLNAVTVLVFGFIGLYAGSMLRKPAKSQK